MAFSPLVCIGSPGLFCQSGAAVIYKEPSVGVCEVLSIKAISIAGGRLLFVKAWLRYVSENLELLSWWSL